MMLISGYSNGEFVIPLVFDDKGMVVFPFNERQIVACDADFGRFWMVDVGAFGVGTIAQTYAGTEHAKGDEKGYFKFGGSTVILVAPAGALAFDADLVAHSAAGLETRVLCCERIATWERG